jgi:hypothetical protein
MLLDLLRRRVRIKFKTEPVVEVVRVVVLPPVPAQGIVRKWIRKSHGPEVRDLKMNGIRGGC